MGLQNYVNRAVMQHALSQFNIECCFDYEPIVTFSSRAPRIFRGGGGARDTEAVYNLYLSTYY
jgi:hypothetical protein